MSERAKNVSEALNAAIEDHKDEGYETIFLVMSNEEHTSSSIAGTGIDLGMAITRALVQHPAMIDIVGAALGTAISIIKKKDDGYRKCSTKKGGEQ